MSTDTDIALEPSAEKRASPATAAQLNTLLAALLGQQQQLATPVVRASVAYDSRSDDSAFCRTAERTPHSAIHRDLIPLTAPGPGEQYAFEVDLDACSGCKSCVSACHSLNGLDDNESWRDVGLILSADTSSPWQQTVTTACHHCAEPACLNGCPVAAYEKDPLTGIVRHLDDQCIGCSYCILKCPYDVPKFNARLGIVRKCDLCHQRLAVDEAPACVQACPTSAIRIVNVAGTPTPAPTPSAGGRRLVAAGPSPHGADGAAPSSALSPHSCACGGSCGGSSESAAHRLPSTASSRRVDTTHFLPAAPDPGYTQPTTRYVSARGIPAHIRAADAGALRVQPAHWPLAAMLTLTQLGVGLLATAPLGILPISVARIDPSSLATALPQLVTYYVANFGAHAAPLVGLALLFAGLGASTLHLGKPLRAWRFFLGLRTSWLSREILVFSALAPVALATLLWPASPALHAAVAATGLLGIACSALIYIDTRRRFWAAAPTCIRFFGTALVSALAAPHPALAAAVLLAKLGAEAAQTLGPALSARLQRGPLRSLLLLRFLLGANAAALLAVGFYWPALAAFAAGELAERLLFFRAVDAPKMPGHAAP